jgi:peptide/nickel transport system substrate-binding protein
MDDPVTGQLGARKVIARLRDREALVRDVYKDTATALYSIVQAGIADKVKLTLWSTPACT